MNKQEVILMAQEVILMEYSQEDVNLDKYTNYEFLEKEYDKLIEFLSEKPIFQSGNIVIRRSIGNMMLKFRETKRKWINDIFQDDGVCIQVEAARVEATILDTNEFYNKFNAPDFETFYSAKVKELHDWEENLNSLYKDFPYWNKKTKRERNTAFKWDIKQILLKVIILCWGFIE